jgi:hypothetical protein
MHDVQRLARQWVEMALFKTGKSYTGTWRFMWEWNGITSMAMDDNGENGRSIDTRRRTRLTGVFGQPDGRAGKDSGRLRHDPQGA